MDQAGTSSGAGVDGDVGRSVSGHTGVAAAVIDPLERREERRAPAYAAAFAHSLAVWRPPLAGGHARLRGTGIARLAQASPLLSVGRLGMVAHSFLLTGLPGLVGYLFHRRWPVLEACPACGRTVPRDRDACAACGTEFPPPPLKGIEVFA